MPIGAGVVLVAVVIITIVPSDLCVPLWTKVCMVGKAHLSPFHSRESKGYISAKTSRIWKSYHRKGAMLGRTIMEVQGCLENGTLNGSV